MIKTFFSKRFVMFLGVGCTAALVNFASRIFYEQWMSFGAAVIFAYINGIATAFTLNKIFVFKDSVRSVRRSAVYYTIVNIFAMGQTWAVSLALAYHLLPWLGVTVFVKEIAHFCGMATPAFTSFLLHSHWTFKSTAAIDDYADEEEAPEI